MVRAGLDQRSVTPRLWLQRLVRMTAGEVARLPKRTLDLELSRSAPPACPVSAAAWCGALHVCGDHCFRSGSSDLFFDWRSLHRAATQARGGQGLPSVRHGLLSQAWDTWVAVYRTTTASRAALAKGVCAHRGREGTARRRRGELNGNEIERGGGRREGGEGDKGGMNTPASHLRQVARINRARRETVMVGGVLPIVPTLCSRPTFALTVHPLARASPALCAALPLACTAAHSHVPCMGSLCGRPRPEARPAPVRRVALGVAPVPSRLDRVAGGGGGACREEGQARISAAVLGHAGAAARDAPLAGVGRTLAPYIRLQRGFLPSSFRLRPLSHPQRFLPSPPPPWYAPLPTLSNCAPCPPLPTSSQACAANLAAVWNRIVRLQPAFERWRQWASWHAFAQGHTCAAAPSGRP